MNPIPKDGDEKSLSDTQKDIILRYLELNPEILRTADFPQNMMQELNKTCQTASLNRFWLDAIRSWKQSVKKIYFYAKKTHNFVSTIEDLRLLVLMQNARVFTTEIIQEEQDQISCRICLTKVNRRESFNLFTSLVENVSLAHLLNSYTSIIPAVKQDGLPDAICGHCSNLLGMVKTFRHLCEKSDQELRENLARTKKSPDLPEQQTNVSDFFDEEDTVSVYNDEYEGGFLEIHNSSDENAKVDVPPKPPKPPKPESSSAFPQEIFEIAYSDTSDSLPSIEIPILPKEKAKRRRKARSYKKTTNATNDEPRKQCEFCEKTYATHNSLFTHRKRTHLKDKRHGCEHCGKHFHTRLAMKEHMRIHTNERPFVCEICGKGFKTLSAIGCHRATHLEKQIQCPVCPYKAATNANLKIHNRSHTGSKPYTCEMCDATFMTCSNKAKHIRNIHNKIKEHKCPHCDRTFFAKQSALKHAVTHTGAKPYVCSICSVPYAWYNGFQKHMRMQHPGVEVPRESTFFKKLENLEAMAK